MPALISLQCCCNFYIHSSRGSDPGQVRKRSLAYFFSQDLAALWRTFVGRQFSSLSNASGVAGKSFDNGGDSLLRCLHLADLHLGWSATWLGTRAAAYASQRDKILERLTTWVLAPEQQLDLVLIVGDLFENHRPSSALVESVMAELKAWVDAGITVITVPGNHDEITYYDSVYQLYGERWPGILVTNPQPGPPQELMIRGERLYLYSLAYTGGLTKVENYLQPYPRGSGPGIHLGAFHGSLDWQTNERGLPLSSQLLAEAGYDYVALGHFHSPKQSQIGPTTIAYAGAIASKGFNDIGCGQLTIVSLQPGAVKVELIPWQAVDHQVIQVDISQLADEDALAASIITLANPELLLQVELQGAASFLFDAQALQSRLMRHFYQLELVDATLHLAAGLQERWAQESTIRGLFVRRMQEQAQRATNERESKVADLALRRGMAAFLQGERQDG